MARRIKSAVLARTNKASSGSDDSDTPLLGDTTASSSLNKLPKRPNTSPGMLRSQFEPISGSTPSQLEQVAPTMTSNEPNDHAETRRRKLAALKPKDWKNVSVKHREKFERLLKIWKNAKSDPELITIINDNGVCFKEEFSIGSGSSGTEVYVCLGSDGIERAIKRLPKVPWLCELLKNERDILTSPNAVDSPRVVNYCFYDDTSSPDFGYLILNLYEKNLEEFVKEEGEKITESRARKMIRQVLEGLKALHAREPRILHRDLKPTNILVDVNGDLVLSDFGIGRFFQEQGIFKGCIYLTKRSD
jgi:hypothetical protein